MSEKTSSIAAELVAGFKELVDALENEEDLQTRFKLYKMKLSAEPDESSGQSDESAPR